MAKFIDLPYARLLTDSPICQIAKKMSLSLISGFTRLAPLVCAAALLGLAGCGGSDSGSRDEALELRIDREREEAAALARQEQRVEGLRAEVRRLKRDQAVDAGSPGSGSASPPAGGAGSVKTFHAPTGNVSCEMSESSVRCSVISIDQTFVLASGSAARMEPGMAVSEGAGVTVGWGESVSLGQISCAIPLEDEPRGITCDDTASGHGFEASRVPARQRTY